jgi:hypothetical protein
MARKHYEVDEVLRALSHKNDIRIVNKDILILKDKVYNQKAGKSITNPKKHFDIGNKSWGKIDFLVKVHEYRQYFVDEF